MYRMFLTTVSTLALGCTGTAAAQATDSDSASETIIVTGEKAGRSLQDTVTSVAVIVPRRIELENILSMQDLFQRTPNVSETYGTIGFTIRGITSNGITGGGNAALATVYVDNAPLPANLLQTAPTDMWDVAQVEILRGPQSTLQGLNALAGAVIIQTTEPGQTWSLRGRAMYTDAEQSQFALAGGGPIITDELAFRVSVDRRDEQGFIWNPTRQTHEDKLESTQLRGKLLWTPSSLPGFEARLGHTYFKRNGGYRFNQSDVTVADFYDNRINTSDFPNDSESRTHLSTLDLRYKISDSLALTAVSTYNDIKEFNRFDNNGLATDEGGFTQHNRYKTFSQEVRLNYESDRLSGVLGAFYYKRKQNSASTSRVGIETPTGTIAALLEGNGLDPMTAGYLAGLYTSALPEIPVDYVSDDHGRVETMALFADGRFALTDRLTLLGGFRYDREKNSIAIDQVTTLAGTLPDPANYGPIGSPLYMAIAGINLGVQGLVAQASGSTPAHPRTFNAFLPKAGIEYAWTDDIKTALTVQRGYRSGGSSTNTARSTTFAFDPEYTWNYELSLRSAWLDGALTVNANAFYTDWKDQQTVVNFGLNSYDYHTVNAGKSHLYGFEIETAHRVNESFDWYAGVGHTRTKFDDFDLSMGSIDDLSGLEFPYAPHWTLSGGFNARPIDRLNINVNGNYRSAVFASASAVSPQADYRIKPRTIVNARISYDLDHWSLSAFASNLFDEKYTQYASPGFHLAVLGAPRVLGVALETRW